jgi:quercetin 2,3-dioxygenase
MDIIRAAKKRSHGNNVFHVDILYPGKALGLKDSGFYTIGRIDHASFSPPGVVPMHPHRDDEILSYMRAGLQVHKDTGGHKEYLSASKLMMMNAGSGIQHEETAEEAVEMLQIFMRPSENGLPPNVQFHQFEQVYSQDQWRLVAGSAAQAPLELRADTNILDARVSKGTVLEMPVTSEQFIYLLYCFNGSVTVNGETLEKGDSAVFRNERPSIEAVEETDLVLFQINESAIYSDSGMYSGNQFN